MPPLPLDIALPKILLHKNAPVNPTLISAVHRVREKSSNRESLASLLIEDAVGLIAALLISMSTPIS